MIIPVVHTPQPASTQAEDEHRELKVALRLLSGQDCERDPSQAQLILLRLSESSDKVMASDTGRIVKAGARNGWFADTAPKHYELERIAEASLARKGKDPLQMKMLMLALGLGVVMAGGIVAFMFARGDSAEPFPIMAVVVALGVIGLAVAMAAKARR